MHHKFVEVVFALIVVWDVLPVLLLVHVALDIAAMPKIIFVVLMRARLVIQLVDQ